MFPEAGSGCVHIEKPPRPSDSGEYPHLFFSIDEADTQYHIARQLPQFDDVHLEVSCGGGRAIDLVLVQNRQKLNRTVGIEIKRADTPLSNQQIKEQVANYVDATAADVDINAPFIGGPDGLVARATDVYLFDEVWLLFVGEEPSYRFNGPEHGGLRYDRSEELAYEIHTTEDRQTLNLRPSRTESWYTSRLWNYFARKDNYCLTTEIKASRPYHRILQEGNVKFRSKQGAIRKPDLVVGDTTAFDPVDAESYIHAIETKQSLSDKQRLDNQLSLYRNSGMFSHVSLAVPEDELTDAYEFIQQQHPDVGLFYIDDNGCVWKKSEQEPNQLDFSQLPVVDTTSSGNPVYWYP